MRIPAAAVVPVSQVRLLWLPIQDTNSARRCYLRAWLILLVRPPIAGFSRDVCFFVLASSDLRCRVLSVNVRISRPTHPVDEMQISIFSVSGRSASIVVLLTRFSGLLSYDTPNDTQGLRRSQRASTSVPCPLNGAYSCRITRALLNA